MKRDMDLIRRILLRLESASPNEGYVNFEDIGADREGVSYHIQLLVDAGFVRAKGVNTEDGMHWHFLGITWKGHDFIDSARSDSVWKAVMVRVGSTVGSVTLDVAKALLVDEAKRRLGLTP